MVVAHKRQGHSSGVSGAPPGCLVCPEVGPASQRESRRFVAVFSLCG
jgi:hypothetical protein